MENIIGECSRDLISARLISSSSVLIRFLAALQGKPFVIFTGLSGSGKTKLSQAIARWITEKIEVNDPFYQGAKIKSSSITYHVKESNPRFVEFLNSEDEDTATRVALTRDIIQEWVDVIKENDYNRSTKLDEIKREAISKSRYSANLHRFDTHLRAAAFAVIEGEPQILPQYEIISVGADWTSKDHILGYPDALEPTKYVKTPALELILRAARDPQHPYFLILDEMNLSHVERYFADFLSAIESSEPIKLHSGPADRDGVPPMIERLPENLYIIGTVNVDETTYMFSPKVLDRANVIEFRVARSELESFLDDSRGIDLDQLDGKGAEFGKWFVQQTKQEVSLPADVQARLREELLLFFDVFAHHGAEFGFRTAKEISRFIYFHQQLTGDNWRFEDAMDAQIMQKLLPKLHGSRKSLEGVLHSLAVLCHSRREWDDEDARLANGESLLQEALQPTSFAEGEFPPVDDALYPLSYQKIVRMCKALDQNGFTSFAEA
ncbi:MAG TPA: hypothetical protein VFV52_11095 [Bacilli bacterium]|nr:hypothetical protein [Bacilli bacterium]